MKISNNIINLLFVGGFIIFIGVMYLLFGTDINDNNLISEEVKKLENVSLIDKENSDLIYQHNLYE
jgi:hypothetical protein